MIILVYLLQLHPFLVAQLQHIVVHHWFWWIHWMFRMPHNLAIYLWVLCLKFFYLCGENILEVGFYFWAKTRDLLIVEDRLSVKDDGERGKEGLLGELVLVFVMGIFHDLVAVFLHHSVNWYRMHTYHEFYLLWWRFGWWGWPQSERTSSSFWILQLTRFICFWLRP